MVTTSAEQLLYVQVNGDTTTILTPGDIGEIENAKGLFNRLPERERESDTGKSLKGQINVAEFAAKTEGLETLQQRVADNDADT